MRYKSLILSLLVVLFCSCKVEFSPNAPWRDVPVVYCVLDIQEDTVWARVQRCYLGEDNLYNYSTITDSTNYPIGDIRVELKAWEGIASGPYNVIPTTHLLHSWELQPTFVDRMPDGHFSADPQPVYYCVPGANTMLQDSDCVFQLLVIRTADGDTLAQATTTLVKYLDYHGTIANGDPETILESPSWVRGHHFGFNPVVRNNITWFPVPRGRIYQTSLRFYYRKNGDTLGIDIPGGITYNEHNNYHLTDKTITLTRFLSHIKTALANNTDSLFNVNHVDITILAGNEELNCYYNSQTAHHSSGQEYANYTNIQGGLGIFASRRTHMVFRVPCDSTGKPNYLPDQLYQLGVGFYGNFGNSDTTSSKTHQQKL